MTMNIKKSKNRFFIGDNIENAIAEITFAKESANVIVINHTYVAKHLRGKGTEIALVNSVVEYAREENIKIIPVCPFAKGIMVHKNEYQDVLL